MSIFLKIWTLVSLLTVSTGAYAKGKRYDYIFKPFLATSSANAHLKPSSKQKSIMNEAGNDFASENVYGPNTSFAPGITVGIGPISITAGELFQLGGGSDDENHADNGKGKTSGENYAFSFFNNSFGMTLFYQNFKGLHLGNPEEYGDSFNENNYPYFSEMKRVTKSLTFYKMFGTSGFSMPAILSQSQKVNEGFSYAAVWTVGLGENSLVDRSSALLHPSQSSFYEKSQNLEEVTLQEINTTIGGGFSQTLGFAYVALYGGVGPSQQKVTQKYTDYSDKNRNQLGYAFNVIASFGISGDTFFGGSSMHYEKSFTDIDEMDIEFSRSIREAFIGVRF